MSRLLMSHSHYKLVKTVIAYKVLKRARQALSRSQNSLSGFRKVGAETLTNSVARGGNQSALSLYQLAEHGAERKAVEDPNNING